MYLKEKIKLSILTEVEYGTRILVGDVMALISTDAVEKHSVTEILNTRPGKYKAIYTLGDFGKAGKRVMDISIIHTDAYANRDRIYPRVLELIEPISMDSGICAIFNYNKITEELSNTEDLISWASQWMGGITARADIYNGHSIVSEAGFGAGDYGLRIYQGKDMKVIGIKVFFIDEYEYLEED